MFISLGKSKPCNTENSDFCSFRPRELNFSSVWILWQKDSDHVHLLKSREVWVELEALWFLLANSSVLNLWVLKTQLWNQSRNQSDSCSTFVVHGVFCLEWWGPGQPNLFFDVGELLLLESKCNFAQLFPKLHPIFQGLLYQNKLKSYFWLQARGQQISCVKVML